MKIKKLYSILFMILVTVSLFGCSSSQISTTSTNDTTQNSEAITITDMVGREVVISTTPKKIVSLLPSDVEILYALNADEQIVGVGEYCNYPEKALKEKSVISTGSETNIEQILALEPDLVIIGNMAQNIELAEQIQNIGIPAIITNSNNINQTYENITLLGQVTRKSDAAKQLISNMKEEFAKISSACEKAEQKTIYFEISPLKYGLWTAGQNTFMQELCDIVHIENIFSDIDGWSEISEEQVLERNPDYIATTATMYETESPITEILHRKNWSSITAVKNKHILCIDDDSLVRPAPRLVKAAKQLAEFVYGIKIS